MADPYIRQLAREALAQSAVNPAGAFSRSILGAQQLQRPADPYLRQQYPAVFGGLAGLLGMAPDEMGGSVLDPNTARVREAQAMTYPIGTALQMLPGAKPVGAGAMAAGRAGERFAERAVPMVMERGGMGAEMLQGMSRGTVSPMDVYHGSPHRFEKFDASKIGTGEGAQAYGHGLYFAEKQGTAQTYKDNLTAGNDPRDFISNIASVLGKNKKTSAQDIVNELKRYEQTASLAENADIVSLTKRMADGYEWTPRSGESWTTDAMGAMKRLDSALPKTPEGSLYKVDLPDDQIAKMLDWDKPLNQQSAYVQAAMVDRLKSIPEDSFSDWTQAAYRDKAIDAFTNPESVDITGSGLYKFLQAQTSGLNPNSAIGSKGQDFASDYLRQAGIPGIRYLDGGSRSTGGGTSNFVVFPGNESMLTIMERNNQPVQQAMQEFEQGLTNFMATR